MEQPVELDRNGRVSDLFWAQLLRDHSGSQFGTVMKCAVFDTHQMWSNAAAIIGEVR
jgi:hypothetical protein